MMLPLPLNPFEASLFFDDRPAYPWDGMARLRFSGRLDRAAMRRAVAATVARHLLLNANVELNGGRPQWVAAKQPLPEIEWIALPAEDGYPPMAWIDITRDFPIRFWVAEGPGRADVFLHVSHVSLDGLGVMQVVREILLAYAAAAEGNPAHATLPPLDESLLPQRDRYGLTAGRLLRRLPKLAVGLLGARQYLMRKPMPLVPHETFAAGVPLGADFPAVLSHTFTETETAAVGQAAKRQGATVNDLLARELFLALGRWRQKRGLGEEGWLRLMVPMNLRTEADRLMPAANIMSTAFLDRRPSDLADPAGLLRGIHDEMSLIKRNQLGLVLVLSLRICRLLPGGIAAAVRRHPDLSTAILSNMNRPLDALPLPRVEGKWKAGELLLESIDIVPAIRPATCVAVGVLSYAQRLSIAMHVDRRVLDAAGSAELRELYVAAIRAAGD